MPGSLTHRPSPIVAVLCGLILAALCGSILATPASAMPVRLSLRDRIIANEAIVGGEVAGSGQFPSLAYIADFKGEEVGLCTGTVVAPRLVLTAAHCAENTETGVVEPESGYRVVTGVVNWSSSTRQVAAVSKVIVYPGFERESMVGDAALLVLAGRTSAPAIPLDSASVSALTAAGTPAIVAGWGNTYAGQQAPTESLRYGETVIQGSRWCKRNAAPFEASLQLCTLDAPSYQAGPCEGDSGGPLMVNDPAAGGLVEVGVTSEGPSGCETTQPSIFTRVSAISSWVQEWQGALGEGGSSVISGESTSVGGSTSTAGSGTGAAGSGSQGTGSAAGGAPSSRGGVYRGHTSQRSSSIAMVVGSGGRRLTALATSILYRCRSGHRFSEPLEGLSDAEPATIGSGGRFTVVFEGPKTTTTLHGRLDPAAGTANGRLRSVWLSPRYGRCKASHVRWSATRAPQPSASVALAAHGGYRGRVGSHGRIRLRIDASGRQLTGIDFTTVFHCRRHRTMRLTDRVLSTGEPEPLASLGTFTLSLAGSRQRGRVDGAFGLIPNVAFGTLRASIRTRRHGRCTTGTITWRASLR